MVLGECDGRLCICDWPMPDGSMRAATRRRFEGHSMERSETLLLRQAAGQIDEYFRGLRRNFDIPLLQRGSEFQMAVWEALTNVPYGSTVAYGDIALHMGRPEAVRAVANAIGANPLSIFVPCHRIVAVNGPGGYAGGAETKQMLLQLEAKNKPRN